MISLLVPFRSDDPQRLRVWEFLRDHYWSQHKDLEIVVGSDYTSGPWCKALAWRDALDRSSGDVVIFMDADCWVPRAVEGAARLRARGHRWVQSQNVVWRLSEASTERALTFELPLIRVVDGDSYEEPRLSSAGVGTVLRREDALDIPLDPRFLGWGWEDPAWHDALLTLLGPPWRYDYDDYAPCVHLWHPPADGWNIERAPVGPNWLLRRRYARAKNRPENMRALLAEFSCSPRS